RFSVWPGTDSGIPASNSAIRATLRLSSPAWLAQPKNTSSTCDQSRLGCFAISALIGVAARSSARTLASEPPKRPIGVRTASQMNTSRIESLPECRALGVVPLELTVSFRSVPAAGQLRHRSRMVLSREVSHALNADVINRRAAGVENSDNGGK